ncbi:MAG: NAD(+)/NADH kinase [Ruminococcus sp.]|nr:NAD(+)/NADH kinase [Ruminococcus sp.]
MKIAIIVNLSKPKAVACAESICNLLYDNGARLCALKECADYLEFEQIEYFDNIDALFGCCDIAVTVGGDGTIIHAAKYAACADKPLIGVNVGRLGFAADLDVEDIGALKRLLSGDYVTENRILLDIEVQSKGPSKHYLAVNDAVVAHGQLSKIVDLSLCLNGEEISKYRADGILFSTPTGSTAYSLSAGGPIISPQMDCILMTPVCPHSLFSRSVLFDGESTLSVSAKIPEGCSCLLTVDGEVNINIAEGDRVIVRKSGRSLKLISINKLNFYRKLNQKLREREI